MTSIAPPFKAAMKLTKFFPTNLAWEIYSKCINISSSKTPHPERKNKIDLIIRIARFFGVKRKDFSRVTQDDIRKAINQDDPKRLAASFNELIDSFEKKLDRKKVIDQLKGSEKYVNKKRRNFLIEMDNAKTHKQLDLDKKWSKAKEFHPDNKKMNKAKEKAQRYLKEYTPKVLDREGNHIGTNKEFEERYFNEVQNHNIEYAKKSRAELWRIRGREKIYHYDPESAYDYVEIKSHMVKPGRH